MKKIWSVVAKCILPVVTGLTVVTLMFSQYPPGGIATGYTGNDSATYGFLSYGSYTRFVGNSAICYQPATGQYIGDSVKQYCSCGGGCTVYLNANMGTPYQYALRQTVDTYDPADAYWYQDWLYVHEDCYDLSAGIPYGEIVEANGTQSCTA